MVYVVKELRDGSPILWNGLRPDREFTSGRAMEHDYHIVEQVWHALAEHCFDGLMINDKKLVWRSPNLVTTENGNPEYSYDELPPKNQFYIEFHAGAKQGTILRIVALELTSKKTDSIWKDLEYTLKFHYHCGFRTGTIDSKLVWADGMVVVSPTGDIVSPQNENFPAMENWEFSKKVKTDTEILAFDFYGTPIKIGSECIFSASGYAGGVRLGKVTKLRKGVSYNSEQEYSVSISYVMPDGKVTVCNNGGYSNKNSRKNIYQVINCIVMNGDYKTVWEHLSSFSIKKDVDIDLEDDE